MLRAIREFFEEHVVRDSAANVTSEKRQHAYQVAASALLIEMSKADFEVQAVERKAVVNAIQDAFELSEQETDELIELAELETREATSLYEFTRLVHEHFDSEQKEQLLELLWRVAYADGELDKYEEHLLRKIADLLYVPHAHFIRSKHKVLAELQTAPGAG